MACLKCYDARENGSLYCPTCGDNLATAESPKHTVNLLMALLGVELLVSLGWIVVQKIISPLLFKTENGELDWGRLGTIYNIFGYFTDAVVAVTALICAILVKNANARVLFILYLACRIAFILAYRVFNHI